MMVYGALIFLCIFASSFAWGDAGVTYHGRLLKPDGTPVVSTAVQFRLQIRTPTATNCLMYEETHVEDLSQGQGVFSITLNDGTQSSINTEPYTLERVFQNRGNTVLFPPGKCSGGDSVTFVSTLSRQLVVSFNDGTFSGWEPLPAQTINFVPSALESVSVGGRTPIHFFRVEEPSGPQTMAPWTAANYQKLLDLVGNTTISGGNASIGGNAAGFTGSLAGDVTGGQASTKVEKIQGQSVLAGTPSDKQVLTWNNAQSRWEAANLPVAGNPDWSDITNKPTSLPPNGNAGGDLAGSTYPNPVIANNAVSGAKIADGGVAFSKIAAGSATGQVLQFEAGVGWKADKLLYTDLVKSGGGSPWPSAACGAGEAVIWQSATDGFECAPISITETDPLVKDFAKADPSSDFETTGGILTLKTVPITRGGTGAVSQSGAINNLLPAQGSNAGKILQTDGTNVTWVNTPSTGITALIGDVTASGSGSVTATIANNAVTSAKIQDGTILASDLDFTGVAGATSGLVMKDSSGKFSHFACMTTGHTPVWTGAGFVCQAPSFTEVDPKIGVNTVNMLSKWSGTELVASALFENAGLVGIGTMTPASPLTVNGVIESVAGGFKFPDGSVQTTAATAGVGGTWSTLSLSDTGSFDPQCEYILNGIRAAWVRTGEIGAVSNSVSGASTASWQLVSAANKAVVYSAQDNYSNNSYYGPSATTSILYRCGSGSTGQWTTAGSNIFYSAGSVGIGTTTPSEKLEVAGNIKATQVCLGSDCRGIWPSADPLADGSVTTLKIADGAVTGAKLETISGLLNGTYGSSTEIPSLTIDTKGRITAISTNTVSTLPTPSGVSGKFLRSDGTSWSGQNIQFSDVKNSLGGSAFNLASCGPSKTVAWSSLTDTFSCQDINNLDASRITTGTLDAARLPSSIANGLWAESSGDVSRGTGNVGIGTTSPQDLLHVEGKIRAQEICDENGGNCRDLSLGWATGSFTLEAWQAPTFQNGWTDYAMTYSPTGYYKDPLGRVHFRGLIMSGTVSACAFTLPVGYRPAYRELFDRITDSNQGRVDVLPSGCVYVSFGSNAWVSLDGISFLSATGGAFSGNSNPWGVAGQDVHYTNGNVGIGTSTPVATLDVRGTQLIRPTSGTEALLIQDSVPTSTATFSHSNNLFSITDNANPISFSANTNGLGASNSQIYLATTGNVGIGTATPSTALDVVGTAKTNVVDGGNGLTLRNGSNGGSWSMRLQGDGISANNLYFDNTNLGGNALTLKSSGNVGIGTTMPGYKLHVNGSVAGSGAYVNLSDRTLKRNIAAVPNALARVEHLRGVSYDWDREAHPDLNLSGRRELGVVAQEVEEVFPEAVSTDSTGIKSVAYSMLISPMIEAVKELSLKLKVVLSRLDSREAEMESLNHRNQALESENAKLQKELRGIKTYLCSKDPTAADLCD